MIVWFPVALKPVTLQMDLAQTLLGDHDPSGVSASIDLRPNPQPRFAARRSDQAGAPTARVADARS